MSKKISPETEKKVREVSSFLRELRINYGYTQAQVAEETNIHRNTILQIENNHNFNIIHLIILAEFYCITLKELFDMD